MAKLRFNSGLHAEVQLPEAKHDDPAEQVQETSASIADEIIEQIMEDNGLAMEVAHKIHTVEAEIKSLGDNDATLRLEQIALESKVDHDVEAINYEIALLKGNMATLEVPIVKEIKIGTDVDAEIAKVEKSIQGTIDKVSGERRNEMVNLVKYVRSGHRLQTAINFVLIVVIVAIMVTK